MKFFQTPTSSQWIGYGLRDGGWFATKPKKAPWLRKEFECQDPTDAVVAISGIGYYELTLNGQRVGDHHLDPIVSVYDKRVRYVTFPVEKYLKPGLNTIGVVLGTGWYDCFTPGPWNFERASWRDLPKLRLEMKAKSGRTIVKSDETWKLTRKGPIIHDGLRTGEQYDARLELTGWNENGYDDSEWENTAIVRGPGGVLEEQDSEPIRIVETIEIPAHNDKNVYDLNQNIAGHARITVKGEAGAKVTLQFTERITEEGDVSTEHQIFDGFDNSLFQTDVYILKGAPEGEVWEPRFTYHGFQYIGVTIEGNAKILKMEARRVNSDVASIGDFTSGNEMVNTLQKLNRRSYLANFVGIPTDCPHREKNGWTGDAQLASETGLCNFDMARCYRQWLGTLRDCQRPDGALPGIAPCCGWGYNWGNGPAWDSALFWIPWNVYVYTGDSSLVIESHEAMKRYLEYLEGNCVGNIVQFGLGDWCPEPSKRVDEHLTNTAIYYGMLRMMSQICLILGEEDESLRFRKKAAAVRKAFNKAFYKGDGKYAEGELTAMGAALYFDLCPNDRAKAATLECLVQSVKACNSKACFGILGAKYVPRVLAEYGYASLAAAFFTQEEFPGWAYWVKHDHATSFHELWGTGGSWNHIMYGDFSGWCFRYPGGFRFSDMPFGYKALRIQPTIIPEWGSFHCTHRGYVTDWTWKDGVASISVTIPKGCVACVILPGGKGEFCSEGTFQFTCPVTGR